MNKTKRHVIRAAKILGSKKSLAQSIKVSAAAVTPWISNDPKKMQLVPPIRCVLIEQVTNGQVTRKDLRPDDWHLIWPELIDQEGAA